MNTIEKHKIPSLLQLLIVLGYFLLLFVSSVFSESEGTTFDLSDSSILLAMKITQVVVVTLVFILPVNGFAYFFRAERMAFLNFKSISPLALITSLTICILALPFINLLQEWNSNLHLPNQWSGFEDWMRMKEDVAEAITNAFFVDKSISSFFVNLFVIAFMAALSEELFFRGLMQRLFIDNKMNPHLAIWVTAILFSAIHVQFFGFAARMILGAILGYLYLYSGTIWAPILAHFMNNAFAVTLVHFAGLDINSQETDLSQTVLISSAILSFSIVSFQLFYLRKSSKFIKDSH